MMQYVNFFGHQVSKLIIGDNPFNGHSYVPDKTPGTEMIQFYTTEKIKETLFKMEEYGYNTLLPLADPYVIRVLSEYKRAGGKMNFIFQTYPAMDQDVSIRQMATVEPIAVYFRGSDVDMYYETDRQDVIHEMLDKYRALGVPVGMGTHRPDVIELSEREGWKADFYMACMQNARKNREGTQSGFITGKTKAGLIFNREDRPIMLEALKKVEKPIIAFKIFAGGQMFMGKTEEEKRDLIKGVYEEVFTALKPNDFAAMGVFQRDQDQLKENLDLFNEWYAEHQAK